MRNPRVRIALFVTLFAFGGAVVLFQNCAGEAFVPIERSFSVELLSQALQEGELHVPMPTKQETNAELILVDRYYLKSLFEDVFGPQAGSVDTAKVFSDALTHGSPCSVYEDHRELKSNGTLSRADSMQACSMSSVNRTQARVNPNGTVSRQALIARACSDLVTNNTTLKYALAKIANVAVPEPTRENIKTAIELFYRNGPDPDEGLIESLQLMFSLPAKIDDWRGVLYTVCVSPQWQVL